MGKYSLDSFEQYPLTKLRPVVTQPQQNCYRLLELAQAAVEQVHALAERVRTLEAQMKVYHGGVK